MNQLIYDVRYNCGGDNQWAENCVEMIECVWPVLEVVARTEGGLVDKELYSRAGDMRYLEAFGEKLRHTPEGTRVNQYVTRLQGYYAPGQKEDGELLYHLHHAYLRHHLTNVLTWYDKPIS